MNVSIRKQFSTYWDQNPPNSILLYFYAWGYLKRLVYSGTIDNKDTLTTSRFTPAKPFVTIPGPCKACGDLRTKGSLSALIQVDDILSIFVNCNSINDSN